MARPGTAEKIICDILLEAAGGMLAAVGIVNFASPAGFPMVGVSGIALIFHRLLGTPIGTVSLLLNLPIAAVCFRILGRRFLLRSLRTMLLTTFLMDAAAPLLPLYQGDKILAALCAGVLTGLGYALIYARGSSTGGADFIVLSFKKKNPHISLGKITFFNDLLVVTAGAFLTSGEIDGLICGILVSFLLSAVVDKVLYGINAGKLGLIITDRPRAVAEKIDALIGRGCTFLKASGSYSGREKPVVLCACNNKQMFLIREAIKEMEPSAFVIILESNEVLGEGFSRS